MVIGTRSDLAERLQCLDDIIQLPLGHAKAQIAGNDLVSALAQPAVNLVERGRNLIQGNGPRTDQELEDRDAD